MTIKEQIDQDLKTAMLAGDKITATTLRGLKSAILYVEVAKGSRDQGLSDAEVIDVLSKEAKKRQESADLYTQGGSQVQADAELVEKTVIARYLPAPLTDEELRSLVVQAITDMGVTDLQSMGKVIGAVKTQVGGQADGTRIAQLVKERLQG